MAAAVARQKKAAAATRPASIPDESLIPEERDKRLLERAEAGDKSVTRWQIRRALERMQNPPQTNLGTVVLDHLVTFLAKDNLVRQECLRREVLLVQRQAAGPDPSPLEALLAERVAVCWLQVKLYETLYAVSFGANNVVSSLPHQKRIDLVNRRYLAAIKTLAQVRRLQIPLSVQVNIAAQGGQQVNVAGDLQPPPTSNGS